MNPHLPTVLVLFLAAIVLASEANPGTPKPSPHASSNTQGSQSAPRRRRAMHTFLYGPEDYRNDEDVVALAAKLHDPANISQFYTSAARLYHDLGVMWEEVDREHGKAEQLLRCVRAMALAAADESLTATHIIYAIARHFVPIFKHRSKPLDNIQRLLQTMEARDAKAAQTPAPPSGPPPFSLINAMTFFFHTFSIRETSQLERFIGLMSRAELRPATRGGLDFSKTPALKEYNVRIRLVLANSLAKLELLLKAFVPAEDIVGAGTSIPERAVRLVRRLWDVHLRRLVAQVQIDDADTASMRYWTDPRIYQKTPISFKFSDWDPKQHAKKPPASKAATSAASSGPGDASAKLASRSSSFWFNLMLIIVLIALFSCAMCIFVSWYRKNRAFRNSQLELEASEPEVSYSL